MKEPFFRPTKHLHWLSKNQRNFSLVVLWNISHTKKKNGKLKQTSWIAESIARFCTILCTCYWCWSWIEISVCTSVTRDRNNFTHKIMAILRSPNSIFRLFTSALLFSLLKILSDDQSRSFRMSQSCVE